MQERQLQRPIPQTLFLFTDATQPVEINKHHRKSPLGMDGLTPPPSWSRSRKIPSWKATRFRSLCWLISRRIIRLPKDAQKGSSGWKKENHMKCSCGNRTFPANCIRIKKKLQLHSLLKWVVRCGWKMAGWVVPLGPSARKRWERAFIFFSWLPN